MEYKIEFGNSLFTYLLDCRIQNSLIWAKEVFKVVCILIALQNQRWAQVTIRDGDTLLETSWFLGKVEKENAVLSEICHF